MTRLAPIMQGFFTDHLITQRHASPHTVASYRDTFRLLLGYAHQRSGKLPAQLDIADLDAVLIGAFLTHLETERGNSAATRNARLTAIRALFRYASLRAPEHAALIARVLAIPAKRTDTTIVCFLTQDETDALIAAAAATGSWHGHRDHALLALAAQTGLRVSELTGLRIGDIHLGSGPARLLPRQGPPRPVHPAHPVHRPHAGRLARRTRRPARRPPVPHAGRQSAVARRGRPAAHEIRTAGERVLPRPERQDRQPAHAQAQCGHGPGSRWHRPHRHRPVDGPRLTAQHQALPPRRHAAQTAGRRPAHPAGNTAGPIPRARRPPGLPRQPLTILPGNSYAASATRNPCTNQGCQTRRGITTASA